MLGIARGSLAELATFVTLSNRLELIQSETGDSLLEECAEIHRLMNGLMRGAVGLGMNGSSQWLGGVDISLISVFPLQIAANRRKAAHSR